MPSRKTFNIQEILDLEADLASRSLDEVIRFFRKRYDLANITYVCASFPERSILNPVVSTTYSDAWVEHYKREGYWFIDPVMNTGARSLLPFDWAWLSRDSKKVRRMFGEAQEAGIGRHGLTIPVRGPMNRVWALFNLTSDESDEAWCARRHELARDFVHVATYVHQRACDMYIEEERGDVNAITKRELEALAWSAEGKTVAETAILMRNSNQTVKSHLESARMKLRARNRAHAVAKAVRAGLMQ